MSADQPWKDEPDADEGQFAGFNWCLKRTPGIGVWCGYVNVPYGHPWYLKDYDDEPVCDIGVHGGITYAQHDGLEWRVGFDCGHAFDLMPSTLRDASVLDYTKIVMGPPDITYKDIAFARGQAMRLCEKAALAAVAQA